MAEHECPMCGELIKKTAKKCRHCGEILDEDLRAQRGEQENPGPDPALSLIVPIGATPMSIATSYLGLFSFCFPPLGPIALVVGVLAIKEIKGDPKQKKGGNQPCTGFQECVHFKGQTAANARLGALVPHGLQARFYRRFPHKHPKAWPHPMRG